MIIQQVFYAILVVLLQLDGLAHLLQLTTLSVISVGMELLPVLRYVITLQTQLFASLVPALQLLIHAQLPLPMTISAQYVETARLTGRKYVTILQTQPFAYHAQV